MEGLAAHRRVGGRLAPDFDLEGLCGGSSDVGGGVGGGSLSGGVGVGEQQHQQQQQQQEEEEEEMIFAADYPGLAAARQLLLEVVQGPGDALFVPSGW